MDAKHDLEQRLAFLGISDADCRRLGDLRPMLERHADALVAAFYRHLLSFEKTRRVLADPGVAQRLRGQQRSYLVSLGGPTLNQTYVNERMRIGEMHAKVGIEPRWYLGAYAMYFSLLTPLIRDFHRNDVDACERAVAALLKILMLDAQLAMEAYIARHQRELEHLNRELAATSQALARDFEEQSFELRETTERARAAENLASMGTLVAGLAHEIGTPMGVIQGHTDALERFVPDERGRWRLQTIREQIERITRIIQALLRMARPRPSRPEPVQVGEVLDATLSFVAERLRRRRIDVDRDVRECTPVLGDREKLQQLFLNLFLNAADAMPEGGRLGVVLAPLDARRLEVRITDTGGGIAADAIDRIFEPFFTTKEAGTGSGLGLVVAKGIVVDHGGEITVESTPGTGTTFRIALPVIRARSRRGTHSAIGETPIPEPAVPSDQGKTGS